ncbi:MAG: GatB/YqeY domain-containing protein [Bacteroidota bacterium]
MSLKQTIEQDLKAAMRAKDDAAKRTLRAIKSAILLVETSENRNGDPLSDKEELEILLKQTKQRRDSLRQYEENDREDLAAKEREEIEVLERYLPKQLSKEELTEEVKGIISTLGASSMKDMGRVMNEARTKLAGKADVKVLAGMVKELLS